MRYTEGIMSDGPVILMDGQPMTPGEIVEILNRYDGVVGHYDNVIKYLVKAIKSEEIETMKSVVNRVVEIYLE